MRAIENAADIIMKNMWFIFQCIFLVYISVLAVMDFKFRKLPLKFLLSGFLLVAAGYFCCTSVRRRMCRTFLPAYQQNIRRSLWIWGQYSDLNNRGIYRILGSAVSAFRGVFYGGSILGSYDDKASFQQKIFIPVCTISCSGIYRRDVHWSILKRERKIGSAKGNI